MPRIATHNSLQILEGFVLLTHHKKFNIKKLSLVMGGIFLYSSLALADTDFGHDTHTAQAPLEKGLIENLTGFDVNKTSLLQRTGVKVGGWTEIGFAGNVRGSKDGTNGPVTFADEDNSFNLHQVYGFFEREVNTSGGWDVGFRADVLYGTDSRFTTSRNFDTDILNTSHDRNIAFPQAYLDIFMPIANGITAKVGHFYTIIGYEVVPSTGNFFFSHAYTMQYGEPFTHSGVLLSYPVNSNISVQGGVVTGWDSNFEQPANFLGSAAYTTDNERTTVTGSLITGDVRTRGLNINDDHNRSMYSIVLEHDVTDRLHYVLQHDLGVEEKTAFMGSSKWYGLNQYLFYEHTHKLSSGVRVEWFRDEDGARVAGNGLGENYIGVTGGVNYKPIQGIIVRPEIRYDVSTKNNAYNGGRDDDQLMLSLSGIFKF